MDFTTISLIIGWVSTTIAGASYTYGLKGRVDGHDVLFAEREKAAAERRKAAAEWRKTDADKLLAYLHQHVKDCRWNGKEILFQDAA